MLFVERNAKAEEKALQELLKNDAEAREVYEAYQADFEMRIAYCKYYIGYTWEIPQRHRL